MRTRRNAATAALLVAVGAVALLADGGKGGGDNNGRLRTPLTGASIQGKSPEGNADFRSDDRGRIRFNVEVENVNLPAGTILTVSVHDASMATVAGTIKLSAFGAGELELNSEDGEPVPHIKSGDMVTVSAGGKRILAGVF